MYSRDPFNVRRNNNTSATTFLRTNSGSLRDSAASVAQQAVSAANSLLETGRQALDSYNKDDQSSSPASHISHRHPSPGASESYASHNHAHAATMTSYALPNSTNNQTGTTSQHTEAWQSSGRSRFPQSNHQHQHNHNHDHDENDANLTSRVSNFLPSLMKTESLPMYKDKPYHYAQSGQKVARWRRRRVVWTGLGLAAVLCWWFGILSPLGYVTHGLRSGEAETTSDGVKSTPSITKQESGKSKWSLFGGKEAVKWSDRAEMVKDAFKISWADYEKHGWGYDEYHPKSKTGKYMVEDTKGMGWIIVDALDTLMLMNLTTELEHARQWLHTDLDYDIDHDVNTFETTIRMMGGLLSAHYLSTAFPGRFAPVDDKLSDDLYVEKATGLADRLLGAYKSVSGIPFASVNLHKSQGLPSHADGGASSTAEATTLQLEMKYLAKLTGETQYWEKAEHVMKAVDDNQAPDGLVPIFIHADAGVYRGNNIRLGSRGDSYYEYLIKQFLQTSRQEPVYQAMWNESLAGVKKHLLTYSVPHNWLVLAERPNGLSNALLAKMDHLVCFMPGTIALAATNGAPLAEARKEANWGADQEEDMRIAEELTKTCMGMYKTTKTGLAPEIAHFNVDTPPRMYNDYTDQTRPQSPDDFVKCSNKACTATESLTESDYDIHGNDVHNLQRPETVESLFYMWRITGDEKYRQWGWEMFQSFIEWTAVADGSGFTSVGDVTSTPPGSRDNMESFWLAETLKYFYLLFSSNDILPLDEVVFNTEAHPFPRFELGRLFKTGWTRKPPGTAAQANTDEEALRKILGAPVQNGKTPVTQVTSTQQVLVTPVPAGDAASAAGIAVDDLVNPVGAAAAAGAAYDMAKISAAAAAMVSAAVASAETIQTTAAIVH